MIPPRASRLVGLSVGQRLLLGLAPALLAVVLVPGLAYYGEIGRQAPGYVVTGAAVLACISLYLTWSNTRYLALRIRRLAGGIEPSRDGAHLLALLRERLAQLSLPAPTLELRLQTSQPAS